MTDKSKRTDDAATLQEHRAEREAKTEARRAAREKATVGVARPAAEDARPAVDLKRALRRVNENVRSTPTNPDWAGPLYLLGKIVDYVMPDGSDAEAKVLDLRDDGTASLLVAVGTQRVDTVYQRQFAGVPLGRAGEVGTWHEVEE